ncbi:MAG: hypothetical protein ACWGN7_07295, partial [Thermodesulfovibrionales bacterium]
FESAIKLLAFLLVGIFVTYGLFDGFGDILEKIRSTPYANRLLIGEGGTFTVLQWTTFTFLSMMAILFLPRQFHVSVVENSSTEHIKKAMWLFPLYLFLINIFVLPIAYGGLLLGGKELEADYFVLTIPLYQGKSVLALFAFIGGCSAATAMIIVESLALSTMVMNSLVMPAVLGFKGMRGFHTMILNMKRVVIVATIFLGYVFSMYIGEFYSLVDIGLKSFEAVSIFAPSFLLGLYWKGGNRKGAFAGIMAGFVIWIYTLLIPALMRAGLIEAQGVFEEIFSSKLLNPTALFGLEGMDRWSNSLFWGLTMNLFLYVSISLLTKQSDEETRQSIIFVDAYSPEHFGVTEQTKTVDEIENMLAEYIGPEEAEKEVRRFLRRNGLSRESLDQEWLRRLRSEAETILSGALGPSISKL